MSERVQDASGSRQLALDIAFRPAMSRDDFLVASSNQAAVEVIDRWPDWPHPALLIVVRKDPARVT